MSGKKKKCYFSKSNIDGVRFFPIPQWTMYNPIIFLCFSLFVIIGCVQFYLGIFHSFARGYKSTTYIISEKGGFKRGTCRQYVFQLLQICGPFSVKGHMGF